MCVQSRVVVFDTLRWRTLQLTETIEDLVDAFVDSKAKLWSSGISQPPFYWRWLEDMSNYRCRGTCED